MSLTIAFVMKHEDGCKAHNHTDAAKRCSDAVNLHVAALRFEAMRKWVAIRLSDGGSDGNLYDSKRDAVRHQLHEQQCAYVCIPPNGMSICAAESFLATHRKLYDAGMRLVDPDAVHGGRQVIPRLMREDQARQIAALR